MALPRLLENCLSLPVISAPMFLVSGPELVLEACKNGVVGSFPAGNARELETLAQWLDLLNKELARCREQEPERKVAPYAVNLIIHPMNPRLEEELALLEQYKVPLVITSVGNPEQVVGRLHAYGATVFHDVVTIKHARKAAAAGVDGLVLVCGGAGGHTGQMNPMAFVPQVREFWPGPLVVGGAISTGEAVRAVEVMGADLAYMGSRFLATQESMADGEYKQMVLECEAGDVVLSPVFSGINAHYLKPSIARAGLNPDAYTVEEVREKGIKAWRDVWSAGHGVGSIHDVPTVAGLIARLRQEYRVAAERPSAFLF